MTEMHPAPRRLLKTARRMASAIVAASLLSATASFAAPAPDGCSGPASGTWLKIAAEGVHSGAGSIAITLYPDDSSRFLVKNGSLYVTFVKASQGTTNACIFLPRPGVYVVALYHDENDNRHIDRSAIGLPTEGYGFSNNPPTLLGLPSFKSVRLNVIRSGLSTHIQMKYP